MRSHVIVLAEPLIDCDLCLPGRCEPLDVEHLAPQRTVEATRFSRGYSDALAGLLSFSERTKQEEL